MRAIQGATMPADGMGRKGVRRRTTGKFVAMMTMIGCLAVGFPAEAGEPKAIRGTVGTVAGSRIFLDGSSVDLAGVPVRSPSGEEISVADIVPGSRVLLYYLRGTPTSVLVYPAMVE